MYLEGLNPQQRREVRDLIKRDLKVRVESKEDGITVSLCWDETGDGTVDSFDSQTTYIDKLERLKDV